MTRGLLGVRGNLGWWWRHNGVVQDDEMEELPVWATQVIDEFCRHLSLERDRSAHTVRAYRSDLIAMLQAMVARGITRIDRIALVDLRTWLAAQRRNGSASTSMQRRASAIRTFFDWARRNQLVTIDPAAGLKSPKIPRTLQPKSTRLNSRHSDESRNPTKA